MNITPAQRTARLAIAEQLVTVLFALNDTETTGAHHLADGRGHGAFGHAADALRTVLGTLVPTSGRATRITEILFETCEPLARCMEIEQAEDDARIARLNERRAELAAEAAAEAACGCDPAESTWHRDDCEADRAGARHAVYA